MLKKRKDPKDVRSYRPVALTNILCKIFESMTNKRLIWYLKKEKKIDDRQFGFRKQRSTIDTISKIKKNSRRFQEKGESSSNFLLYQESL